MSEASKIFCSNCGTQAVDGAVFCSKCGARLYIEESQDNENNTVYENTAKTAMPLSEAFADTLAAVDEVNEWEEKQKKSPADNNAAKRAYDQNSYQKAVDISGQNTPPKKSKKKGCLTSVLVTCGIFVFIGIVGSLADDDVSSSNSTNRKSSENTAKTTEAMTTQNDNSSTTKKDSYSNYENNTYDDYDYYEPYETTAAILNMDPALIGRWRDYDGGVIELSSDGSAKTDLNLTVTGILNWQRGDLKWCTENGQLKLLGTFYSEQTFNYSYYYDEYSKMDMEFLSRTLDGRTRYNSYNDVIIK